jgi:SAM-dependent methyltransferase
MGHSFSGEGPGIQTPDGCSVSLYLALPYMGELEEVIDLFQPSVSVLELGCGTGRLCSRLLEIGCTVTGVDESPEMLACLPEQVHAVQSKVEALDLEKRYDIVLLASHLINHPDAEVREAFVRCAKRHLNAEGRFVVKRHSVAWLESAKVGLAGEAGGSAVHIEAVDREAGVVHMRLRYELGVQTWSHSFSTTPLSEAEVETLLSRHGFRAVWWVGKNRLWAVAETSDA